jgi:preprotein translocase subunit SecE
VSERAQAAGDSGAAREVKGRGKRRGIFARIVLFFRQVVAELKKVVRPTRAELGRYVAVVLAFLVVVMAFVTVVDLGVGAAVGWAFGS